MSTFRGIVQEFPDIRIDYFRPIPDCRPALKYFLSHVHSDHLVGLETKPFHGSFIYCSPATREILLRLEKYPHRLNFQKGILESRKITYKHLEPLLKTIPLETPTRIELQPGNEIQVTLFDANHCIGAVMFLIEGDNKAILYTGDIRSEPWFVNKLTRNPFIIEYASGLKTLDSIYLDTSNTFDIPFPTKAHGLKELLQKVTKYPEDTVFHFAAWTFGYEEVWMALSRTLKSQIHVDDYKLGLYESLRGNHKDLSKVTQLPGLFLATEGPALTGYKCGNGWQVGCLTRNTSARIHSCEKGLHCSNLNKKTVWIRPIITRTEHGEIGEVGIGGGGGDLTKRIELEIDNEYVMDKFLGLFSNTEDLAMVDMKRKFHDGLRSNRTTVSLDDMGLDKNQDNLPLTKFTEVLAQSLAEKQSASLSESLVDKVQSGALPRVITFPYSRHSSYEELCHLIRVFKPKDVYPCTVDEASWDEDVSIKVLFGKECSATKFRHDNEMRVLHAERHVEESSQQTQTTANSELSSQPSSPVHLEPHTLKLSPRRNFQGQHTYNTNSNVVVPPGMGTAVPNAMAKAISVIKFMPPSKILDVSPRSKSQTLRHKANLEDLRDHPPKRARYDGPDSSSSPIPSSILSTPHKEHSLFIPERYEKSDDAGSDSKSSQDDELVIAPAETMPLSAALSPGEDEEQFDQEKLIEIWDDKDYNYANSTFVDKKDNIVRCSECGHEVWAMWMTRVGFCTNCSSLDHIEPYFEIIDPEAGPCPDIEPGVYASIQMVERGLGRRNIVGDYLDEKYDTQDECAGFEEEYDLNDPFIDDASTEASENGDASDRVSNEEMKYEQLFNDLQVVHSHLATAYNKLDNEYHELLRDIPGPGHDMRSEKMNSSDIEDTDEDGDILKEVDTPNQDVAKFVLSQAQEQSQESEVSADRISNRVNAFSAAVEHDWQSISMVSTGDNHIHEEIEL